MKYKCPKCQETFEGKVSFCPHCGAKMSYKEDNEVSLNNNKEDTTKFNEQFKKILIFDLIGNASLLLFLITLLFVPFFVAIVYTDFIAIPAYFSIFEAATTFLRNVSSISFGFYVFWLVLSIYCLIAIVTLIVLIIKNIINLTHLNDYYLMKYDNLINRVDESRLRQRRAFDSIQLLISGIILFVFGIVFDKMPYVGLDLIKGVNGLLAFIIIFFVAAMTFSVIRLAISSNIKKTYLKDKYGNQK